MNRIEEEDVVEFSKYDQLSFEDLGSEDVELFVDDLSVGHIKVWQDSEMDNREYICLNYEIVYLDELRKK
jgi:hypothetical protein